jgi:hypothetical protein
MSIKDAILITQPTSYWPLDDPDGFSCHDEMGLHNAARPPQGVTLAVIPFGASQAPYFDGALGSFLTIPNDLKYSQPYAKALTVAAWTCPLALDNANTTGTTDQYVHFVEKAVGPSRLPARGMAPTWSMAFRRMTRRQSSSASGYLW